MAAQSTAQILNVPTRPSSANTAMLLPRWCFVGLIAVAACTSGAGCDGSSSSAAEYGTIRLTMVVLDEDGYPAAMRERFDDLDITLRLWHVNAKIATCEDDVYRSYVDLGDESYSKDTDVVLRTPSGQTCGDAQAWAPLDGSSEAFIYCFGELARTVVPMDAEVDAVLSLACSQGDGADPGA